MPDVKKPIVLVTTTFPEALRAFFAEVADAGYDLEHFDAANQEGLLQRASEISDTGKPVSLICSNRMTSPSMVDPAYRGDFNGDELTKQLKEKTQTPTLTIIYSSEVHDNNTKASDGKDSIVTLGKKISRSRQGEASMAVSALNNFYA